MQSNILTQTPELTCKHTCFELEMHLAEVREGSDLRAHKAVVSLALVVSNVNPAVLPCSGWGLG